jgi:hypothetical protein
VPPAGELEGYLAQGWGWPEVKQVGWVYYHRHQVGQGSWEQRRTSVSSVSPQKGSPRQLAQWLRGHWGIENRTFWVRDVTYGEDRFTGRRLGLPWPMIRNLAISLIQGEGYHYIPDGWRELSARPDLGMVLLRKPGEH